MLLTRKRTKLPGARASLRAALCLGVMLGGAPAQAQDALRFSRDEAHRFAGLGTQVWHNAPHRDALLALLRDLHIRAVRLSVGPSLPKDGLRPEMSVDQLRAAIDAQRQQNAATGRSLEQARDFAGQLRELKIRPDLILWGAPDAWTRDVPYQQRDNPGQKGHAIEPARIPSYAHLVVANVLAVRELGFDLRNVEMTNEPHGPWNTRYSPEEFSRLLGLVRRGLDERGLQAVGIDAPGVGAPQTVRYLEEIQRRGQMGLIANISLHRYNRDALPSLGTFPDLSAFRKDRPDLGLVISEFNTSSSSWRQAPLTFPNKRGGQEATRQDRFGVAVAADALNLIAQGAREIFYWEAQDQRWGDDSWGLLDVDGHRRPAAEALRAIFSRVPENAAADGAVTPGGVVGVAFARPQGAMIALANLTEKPQPLRLDPGSFGRAEQFQASAAFPAATALPALRDGLMTMPPASLIILEPKPAP